MSLHAESHVHFICNFLSRLARLESAVHHPFVPRNQARVVWENTGWPRDTGALRAALARGLTSARAPSPRVDSSAPAALNDLRPVSGRPSPRQVFEEEHHVLYLDHGGVIVAIKDTSIPLKILK